MRTRSCHCTRPVGPPTQLSTGPYPHQPPFGMPSLACRHACLRALEDDDDDDKEDSKEEDDLEAKITARREACEERARKRQRREVHAALVSPPGQAPGQASQVRPIKIAPANLCELLESTVTPLQNQDWSQST